MMLILTQVKSPNQIYNVPKSDLKPVAKDDGLRKLNNTIVDILFHITTLGLFGGYKAVLAHIIQIERMKKHCDDATLFVVLNYVQTTLCIVKKMFDKAMENVQEEHRIFTFSSDKVFL